MSRPRRAPETRRASATASESHFETAGCGVVCLGEVRRCESNFDPPFSSRGDVQPRILPEPPRAASTEVTLAISSGCVGLALTESFEDISVRRILAYAAGIGDISPAVFDDAGDDLVAPPAFCVSLEWPVASHPSVRDALSAEPAEILRVVHASQDSVFHSPVRPGDRLRTSGRVTGLRATGSGALATIRLATQREDGEPVVTSWLRSLYRGVGIDGEAKVLEDPPALPAVPDGGSDEAIGIVVARELPHVYTECARIWNPIHTERRVADAAGLPDLILHGTATWALAGREIVARHAAGDPRRLRRLHGRFRAMVIPGTTVTLHHRAVHDTGGHTLVAFRVANADGDDAISDGVALID